MNKAIDFTNLFSQLNKLGYKFYDPYGSGAGQLGSILTTTLPYIFGAAGILLLLYFLYGGLQLMLSKGDPKAIQAARDKITGALIGFVIIFVSFWVVQILANILGLKPILQIFK